MKRMYRWLFGTAPYKFEVFLDSIGSWRWRLRAENGQILASSEAYSGKDAALRTVESLHRWTGIAYEVIS